VIVLPVKVLTKICIANAEGDTMNIVKNKTNLLILLRRKFCGGNLADDVN
jgi:hypothetical protein